MSKIRGNKTLSGTWGEVWVDGEKIFELSKVELKITANREDVQLGLDVDSKMTGLKGELTLTTKKVYSRYNAVFENWKKGIDQRSQIITKLADPDAFGAERVALKSVSFDDLTLADWEADTLGNVECPFTFRGFEYLDMVVDGDA